MSETMPMFFLGNRAASLDVKTVATGDRPYDGRQEDPTPFGANHLAGEAVTQQLEQEASIETVPQQAENMAISSPVGISGPFFDQVGGDFYYCGVPRANHVILGQTSWVTHEGNKNFSKFLQDRFPLLRGDTLEFLLGSIAEWKRQGNLFLKTDESSPRVSPSHFFLPSLEEVFGHAHHTFLHDFELFVESAYQQFEQQSSQYGSRPSSARTQEENWQEKLARTQEENWQKKLRELESFKKKHGHVLVPKKYPPNQPLSTWLSHQRNVQLNDDSSNKLKCAATKERRRQQLRSLGVTFPFEQSQDKSKTWQEKFRELESFKKEHGHVQIPHKYPPNQPLSTWLRNQRNVCLNDDSSNKLKCAATRERRRQQLQSLGVTFPFEQPLHAVMHDKNWQEKFRELESFKKEHGHVQIPDKYPRNQPLSTWLRCQRCIKLNDDSSNKLKCAATRERRRQQLQSLGVTFPFEQTSSQGRGGPTPQDEIWQEKFRELESFKKEHGHVQIPHKYPPNQPLSTWLRNQRYIRLNEDSPQKLKCAATRERRRQQLQSLGVTFPFEQPSSQQGRGGRPPQDENWQEKFRELESFKKEHGHVQIAHKYAPNQPLSTWLRNQRYCKLNEDSSKKLKYAATRERRRQQLRSLGVTFPVGPNAAHCRKRISSDDYSHNPEAKKLRLATWPCASFGDVQVYHV